MMCNSLQCDIMVPAHPMTNTAQITPFAEL